ncbi:sporulation protein YpjB [Halalkalibacter nanhaiisediminis]|uniref:Sporulation protein YpjB n=1 Tax=Halalkalibacter nanhaiisediminis TaxID=688079 RepID=A0A562QQA8_9BACI|nr:sporulation protein YpjB [Halalkalibacter nanhaiisediminis]TWI58885.1 sporulation protein YpjB [Halalkalibacter nanhaiisediminis]
MRQLLSAIIIVVLLSFPTKSFADGHSSLHTWKELNQTSDQILQLVKREKYAEAKQLLDYFSKHFLEVDFQAEGVTMSSLRTTTMAYEKAIEAVTATDLPLEERIYQVTTFRLAVDALSSEHHPLWLHSEQAVMHALAAIKATIFKGDSVAYQHRLNEFLRHYQMIKPALFIDIEPQHLQRLESQVIFLEKLRANQLDPSKLTPHLELMEKEWANLYHQVKEDSADPSLWWVIFTIGGMIILSLSYVGWRKYRAEKQKVRMKE